MLLERYCTIALEKSWNFATDSWVVWGDFKGVDGTDLRKIIHIIIT